MNRWLVILGLISCSVFAQDNSVGDATVSGRVVDRTTQQPVPFVTVTVTAEDAGGAVPGALTDESGRFIIAGLAEGNYVLTSSLLGYQRQIRESWSVTRTTSTTSVTSSSCMRRVTSRRSSSSVKDKFWRRHSIGASTAWRTISLRQAARCWTLCEQTSVNG